MGKYLFIIVLALCFRFVHVNGQDYPYSGQPAESEPASADILFQAADEGDTLKVKLLLEMGVSANVATWQGFTPIMFAAQHGFSDVISILLRKGANVNAQSEKGYTALIIAIANGYIETAEMLIRNGSDVNMADASGITPLMHAISVDTFYMPDLLLYYDAQVNAGDNEGRTALMLAAQYGLFEISIRILEMGAQINAFDESKNTPLHYAVAAGKNSIVELLLLNGADIHAQNSAGYTPLAIAVAKNNYKTSKLLIGFGADVNTRIGMALNPLSLAMNNGNDSIKTLLLNNDAEMLRKPNFNYYTLGATFRFNDDDSHTGLTFGLSDNRYHLMADVEYAFRLKAVQVLDKQDAQTYYQFWERRHFVTLSIGKGFFKQNFGKHVSAMAYASISQSLTFGGYKGSEKNPGIATVFNPRVGCMFDLARFRVKFGYEWMNLNVKNYNENWFGVSLEYLINRKRGLNRIP